PPSQSTASICCRIGAMLCLSRIHPSKQKLKYEEARDCDPDEPDPYWRIGLALATREDFDRAVEQYAEAEKRWRARGESTPDYVLRSWAYDLASLERFDDAVRKCEASIAASPDDADLYFNFGNVLSSSASHAEAIEQLDRAIRLDGNDPYYHHNKV